VLDGADGFTGIPYIAVFSGHPFHYLTQTAAVFIGGKRVE